MSNFHGLYLFQPGLLMTAVPGAGSIETMVTESLDMGRCSFERRGSGLEVGGHVGV